MKRKLGLLLAMVLAVTMVMGVSITSLADPAPPQFPEHVECGCTEPGHTNVWHAYFMGTYAGTGSNEGKTGAIVATYTNDNKDQEAYEGGIFVNVTAFGFNEGYGWYYLVDGHNYVKCHPSLAPASAPSASFTHVHEWIDGVIYDATCTTDGLEGTYCKTCGYVLNSSPIPAMGYTLETYAKQKIDAAKSGQRIVLEFGELNSFPKSFMEDVAAKVAAGVTFEFRYNWNHKLQKITIPAYCTVDTALDWYGPATMQQLYGAY